MSERREPDIRKATLRNDVDFKLASMSEEERSRQSRVIVEKILNHPKYKTAMRICLFLSLSSEVDTSRVLEDALMRGASAFVPQYSKGVMNMLKVENGDMETMVQTSWGIKQHAKNAIRENALDGGGVDLVIAPGAAFSTSGRRCGHGGGYYDRYLSELQRRHSEDPDGFRAPYILAVAFNEQIYSDDSIPMNDGDVMVHEVVTA